MARRIAFIFAASLITQGCGTTKGYIGKPDPNEPLATLYPTTVKSGFLGVKSANIAQVDGKVVGSYMRGYPKKVKIKPGKRVIRIRYYDSKRRAGGQTGSVIAGMLGGAIGGAIAGALQERKQDPMLRDLKLDAAPGAVYRIAFSTTAVDDAGLDLRFIDEATGEVVAKEESRQSKPETSPAASSAKPAEAEVEKRSPPPPR